MEIEIDRTFGEGNPGLAPSDGDPTAIPGLTFSALSFDPREFMQFVEDEDLTEEQAGLLLGAIWEIVVAFVDLGFGIHPVQAVVDRFPNAKEARFNADSAVINSMPSGEKPRSKTTRRGLSRKLTTEES